MDVSKTVPPASRAAVFRTRDLDEARDHITRTFVEHEMHVPGDGRVDLSLSLAASTRISVGHLRYGTHLRLEVPPMRECYHINLSLTGSSGVVQEGRARSVAEGMTGAVFLPDSPVTIHWTPEAVVYAIKVPREALETHAARLVGQAVDETIRFDLAFDLTSAPGQALFATADFLYRELARPGGLGSMPSACSSVESALMTQLLMVVPSQLTPLLHQRNTTARRANIAAVVDHIDAHPQEATSTAALAARVGLSERALQAGFHEFVGMSPGAYQRRIRLDHVHEELLAGSPHSVTEVAAKWQFFHPGRFASQYKERFGMLPSETVRRCRDQLSSAAAAGS